jgi:predicted permease
MKTLRRFVRRLTWWATSARGEEGLREEIEAHISLQTDENLRAGLEPEEARRLALLKFGNVEAIKEIYRDQRGLPFLETLLSDVRHAARRLPSSPGFTIAVLLTLALGIGANIAIFGVIDSILIRPLGYPQADDLVGIWHTAPGLPGMAGNLNCSESMYFTYRDENRTFAQFGLWSHGGASVTGTNEPELPPTLFVTYGVLDALNVKPLLGRWFTQADDTPGSEETVILTYGYWQRRFAGDKSILGRKLDIDSKPRTVIGVMPEEFRFQYNPELILPQRLERNKQFLGGFSYQGIARLKPGVSIQQANADVARMLGIWLNAWPPNPGLSSAVFQKARFGPKLQPLKQEIVGDAGTALGVVMGTLTLVLLIACANVANLLLVRAEGRHQELAIRAALGAGWLRIAREMLAESMTLAVLGGLLGLGLAYAGLKMLVANGPATLPRLSEIGLDPLGFGFAAGVSLLCGGLFGVIPILKYARPISKYTSPRVTNGLRGAGRGLSQSRERHRARNMLAVMQMALALVLLIASGLMIRTFQRLRSVQPGFTHAEEIQVLHARIPESIAKEPERVMRVESEILDKLSAIPGVTSVGFGSAAPLESFLPNFNPVYAEDRKLPEGEVPPMRQIRKIAPGYFKTMGTRVLAGRDFTWTDLYGRRRVAIVSDNLAREWWGNPHAALGKRIREGGEGDSWREIVGVTENIYDDGVQSKPPSIAYWPALMDGYIWAKDGFSVVYGMYAIRSKRAGTEGLLKEAQQIIWSANGRQPVFLVTTLKDLYDQTMARTSFTLVMLAIAGGMALVLGIVGIYGVIAYAVSQRTREIGIRTALGAKPAKLLGMFVRDGLLLAGIGAVLGLTAAAGLTRLMASLLFGVTALDPLTYGAVSVLLILAAVVASYIPARRAMAVDPSEALRAE